MLLVAERIRERMKRSVNMDEISDGKLYDRNDMVKADCHGCEGCSACCSHMGNSVILDPLDVYNLTVGLTCTFEELLEEKLELHVVDGMILPNLKMAGENECCSFLDGAGRCSIHGFRPGFCRLFPLGRYYDGEDFRYFLQIHECKKKNRAKVKVHKWIGIPDIREYEDFIANWHYFVKELSEKTGHLENTEKAKEVCMYLLASFYLKPYQAGENFYSQFYKRLEEAREYMRG